MNVLSWFDGGWIGQWHLMKHVESRRGKGHYDKPYINFYCSSSASSFDNRDTRNNNKDVSVFSF